VTINIELFQNSSRVKKQEGNEIIRRAIRDADAAFNKLVGPMRARTGVKQKESKKSK